MASITGSFIDLGGLRGRTPSSIGLKMAGIDNETVFSHRVSLEGNPVQEFPKRMQQKLP